MSTKPKRTLVAAAATTGHVDQSPRTIESGSDERSPDSLVYLYCLVDSGSTAHQLLRERQVAGLIDGMPLFPIEAADLVGAASDVPATLFAEAPLNELVADLPRLTPFAIRHQSAIATLFAAAPAMIPVGFGSVYRDPAGIARMLQERVDDFRPLLARVRDRQEWGLRVTADAALLRSSAESASETLQKLAADAASAPRGRAYLLTKQRERLINAEADRLAGEALTALLQQLTDAADEVRQDALPTDQVAGNRQLVLKAAFLVQSANAAAFRAVAAEQARLLTPRGLMLDLTGPWAPYSFVGRQA
jgi:hypothetical protein